MTAVRSDLLALTASLVDVPSVSRDEESLADLVAAELGHSTHLEVTRVGHNVVARTMLGRSSRIVVAGHLDTVPANGNATARIEDDRCYGLGAADMKGGLAVMLALAPAVREPAPDVTWIWYACEEIANEHSGLLEIARARPDLIEADLAILCEPTAGVVEAGCQGVLRVTVRLGGVRAHTARPWMGVNAIHRLAPVLERVAGYQGRRPVLDGCEYREALQVVDLSAGVAGNVVPDEARLLLDHRVAPDRDRDEAFESVRALIDPALDPALGDEVTLKAWSRPAPPSLAHPGLGALVAATGEAPRAKLGWTDVSFFAERGVPAANFGPGDPTLAHSAGEWVGREDLESAYGVLAGLLGSPW